MKKMRLRILLIATLLLIGVASATYGAEYRVSEVPNVQLEDRRRFVSNPDGILSDEAVTRLDSLCFSLRERGIAEVVVVALDDIEPRDMVEFSQELFEGWGVGDDKLDNGLGILLVGDMREIRFHTGYGLEGVLPDALCYEIQQEYMVPYFRDGDYSSGMVAGVEAVDAVLTTGELPVAEDNDAEAALLAAVVTLLLLAIVIFCLVMHDRSQKRCPKCGKQGLKVVQTEVTTLSSSRKIVIETLRCEYCGHAHTRRRDIDNGSGGGGIWVMPMGGSGRGGGFGGGGFGGFGGGGFGGGSFGGGGSGSSW